MDRSGVGGAKPVRPIALVAALALSVTGLAGCSNASSSKVVVQGAVAAAAVKSESAVTFHMTMSGTAFTPGTGGGAIRLSASGDFDLSSQRERLAMQLCDRA